LLLLKLPQLLLLFQKSRNCSSRIKHGGKRYY
jgi:hypothetical protein